MTGCRNLAGSWDREEICWNKKLNELEQSDIYPFHMPGHKRAFLPFANPYAIDITEIEGFDNLHHASGILQEAQQKAADLYGAKKRIIW